MDEFQPGDRFEYVGNNSGQYQDKEQIGKQGTVLEYAHDNFGGVTNRVRFDDGVETVVYTANISKIDESDTDPVREVMDKYIGELNSIFVSGTFVPHYTAVGLITEFVREYEAARDES